MDIARLKQLIKEDKLVKFYQCPAWRKVRSQALTRDNNECRRCKALGKVTVGPRTPDPTPHRSAATHADKNKIKSLHVHHKKEVKDFPELALVLSNLETLCQECHNKEHDRLKIKKRERKRFNNTERW